MPALFVVFAEHLGHLFVTSDIVGRDLIKDPGLHRSLFADGLSNVISGLLGSTPNTTYGENMEGIDEVVTAQAMALVEAGAVVVKVDPAAKGIYVRSTVRTERGEGVSEIRDSHTNIVLTAVNGRVLSKKEKTTTASYNVLLTELKRLKLSEIRGFVENM